MKNLRYRVSGPFLDSVLQLKQSTEREERVSQAHLICSCYSRGRKERTGTIRSEGTKTEM